MNSGYRPVVADPNKIRVQTLSESLQKPFYFGGSQVPSNLNLPQGSYSGSGLLSLAKAQSRPIQSDKGRPVPKVYKL